MIPSDNIRQADGEGKENQLGEMAKRMAMKHSLPHQAWVFPFLLQNQEEDWGNRQEALSHTNWLGPENRLVPVSLRFLSHAQKQ